jgi:hypothetical protein
MTAEFKPAISNPHRSCCHVPDLDRSRAAPTLPLVVNVPSQQQRQTQQQQQQQQHTGAPHGNPKAYDISSSQSEGRGLILPIAQQVGLDLDYCATGWP